MAEQLSLKAAMPLAEILATCRKNVSNTGPCIAAAYSKFKSVFNYCFRYQNKGTSMWISMMALADGNASCIGGPV